MYSSGLSALDFLDDVHNQYGVDSVDDVPPSVEAEAVVVPESVLTISDDIIQELSQRVNPLAESDNYGIELYQEINMFMFLSSDYDCFMFVAL